MKNSINALAILLLLALFAPPAQGFSDQSNDKKNSADKKNPANKKKSKKPEKLDIYNQDSALAAIIDAHTAALQKIAENSHLSGGNTNLMADSNSTQNLTFYEKKFRRKSSPHSQKMRKKSENYEKEQKNDLIWFKTSR